MSDRWLHRVLAVFAFIAGTVLLLILLLLIWRSLPLLRPDTLWQAFTTALWQPKTAEFGLLAMLAASLLVSLLALLLAAPLGVLFAVWLNFYVPAFLKPSLRAMQELLAGIPSVVYGLWGLLALVPLINHIAPPGASLLTASLVLMLMILPFSAVISDAAIQHVASRRLPAAHALGLSKWGTFTHVIWPESKPEIITGVVLQLGRALGETMAVLMVAGNVVQLPDSIFAPVRTLTANIALEMGYASGMHQIALFLSGLALLLLTFIIMLLPGRRDPLI